MWTSGKATRTAPPQPTRRQPARQRARRGSDATTAGRGPRMPGTPDPRDHELPRSSTDSALDAGGSSHSPRRSSAEPDALIAEIASVTAATCRPGLDEDGGPDHAWPSFRSIRPRPAGCLPALARGLSRPGLNGYLACRARSPQPLVADLTGGPTARSSPSCWRSESRAMVRAMMRRCSTCLECVAVVTTDTLVRDIDWRDDW